LQKAATLLDEEVFSKQNTIALDYVMHNSEANFSKVEDYDF